MDIQAHKFRRWGAVGAFFAALFAVWMFFFPGLVASHFAWVAEPRLAQVFIGAGYVFRTGFFLSFVFVRDWRRLRWTFWGNLAFTGTLLLATFWHADEFNWRFIVAHVWVILYVSEPVTMIYLIPRRDADSHPTLTTGGPVQLALKRLLVLQVAILGTLGALLIINPEFVDLRWPWALNPLDARIIAAWFTGWSVWAGTMAFAQHWDQIRVGARLNILFGLAVLVSIVAFAPHFDFGRVTTLVYAIGTLLLTLTMIVLYWRQERARPAE